jgi:hypothetical protein
MNDVKMDVFTLRNFLSLAIGEPVKVTELRGYRKPPPDADPPLGCHWRTLAQPTALSLVVGTFGGTRGRSRVVARAGFSFRWIVSEVSRAARCTAARAAQVGPSIGSGQRSPVPAIGDVQAVVA